MQTFDVAKWRPQLSSSFSVVLIDMVVLKLVICQNTTNMKG